LQTDFVCQREFSVKWKLMYVEGGLRKMKKKTELVSPVKEIMETE
jgi:hypothetical protein